MSKITLDATVFDQSAINPETTRLNADIVARLSALPDQWDYPVEVIRANRKAGKGPFPLAPQSDRARMIKIDGPGGKLSLRVLAPDHPKGVYLHIHGGGWTIGGSEEQDPRLERILAACNLAVVSVEYRLAPEHPHPAARDDCVAAADWLIKNAEKEFGVKPLAIGGESAGAHLAVLTLLRLRGRGTHAAFSAANLIAGCYDLALTPSVRRWGTERLVLNTNDITEYVARYLPDGADPADPSISPIHADLGDLPPALFTVGTRDPLLDDSLFMAMRWVASGNDAELAVYPGAPHVFVNFEGPVQDQAAERIHGFLNARAQ